MSCLNEVDNEYQFQYFDIECRFSIFYSYFEKVMAIFNYTIKNGNSNTESRQILKSVTPKVKTPNANLLHALKPKI